MEKAIDWMGSKRGRVRYSMAHRMGPGSYDCSSSVYFALIHAGIFPAGIRIGNTETLFIDLEKYGFEKLPMDASGNVDAKRGDVFIWGRRGHSLGAAGHTGIMVDPDNMIHCNYGHNGITVNGHDYIWQLNGQPAYTFYRFKGHKTPAAVMERKAIKGIHAVEHRAVQHGIEQVLSPSLYGSNPDWEHNGIPVAAISKVDDQGNWIPGKTMPGEKFVVPGLFVVNRREKDEQNGRMYALLENVGGHEVWVLDEILTDKETPRPNPKPAAPAQGKPEVVFTEPKPTPESPELTEQKKTNGLLTAIADTLKGLLNLIKSIFGRK